MKRQILALGLAVLSTVAVVALAPDKAEAACRYARDYDSIGRRCGKRSAEMRGPTSGYDRGGSGGREYMSNSAQDARDASALKRRNAELDRQSNARLDATFRQSEVRAAARDVAIANYKSGMPATVDSCQLISYCPSNVERVAPMVQNESSRMTVSSPDGSMNLRATPNGTVLRSVANEVQVTVISVSIVDEKHWYKVQLSSGDIGFIRGTGLRY